MMSRKRRKHGEKGMAEKGMAEKGIGPYSGAESFVRVFSLTELVHKIVMLNPGVYRPYVMAGMTCKEMHRALWANKANFDLIRHFMTRWDPRRIMATAYSGSLSLMLPNYARDGGSLSTQLNDARMMHLVGAPNVPLALREPFLAFAKRVLHMDAMVWCGMCGMPSTRRIAFWLLGTRVCLECRSNNFASQERLQDVYGLRLDTRFCGRMLIEYMMGRVFVVYTSTLTREQLLMFTAHVSDIRGFTAGTKNFFVWLPQLAQIVDLEGLRTLQNRKKRAAVALDLPAKVALTDPEEKRLVAAGELLHRRHAQKELACYLKRAAIRRIIILAQNESHRKQWPSKLFTMNQQQKETFLEAFRGRYNDIYLLKKKRATTVASVWKGRGITHNVHAFGPQTHRIVRLLEQGVIGSQVKSLGI